MVTIRDAQLDDAEAIARIHVASWRVTYVGVFPAEYLDAMVSPTDEKVGTGKTEVLRYRRSLRSDQPSCEH